MYTSNLNCSEETYTFIPSDAPVSLALSDANRAVSAANDLLGPVHLNSITNMVNNALVHAEVKATLRQGVKLDASRPEYHRVKLEYIINRDGNLELYAKSTGVQRSSRLMSMLDADGLMMLPRGVKGGKDRIDDGESHTVLLSRRGCQHSGIGVFGGIAVKDSLHLGRCISTVGLLENFRIKNNRI
jgi:hypothetical protein